MYTNTNVQRFIHYKHNYVYSLVDQHKLIESFHYRDHKIYLLNKWSRSGILCNNITCEKNSDVVENEFHTL